PSASLGRSRPRNMQSQYPSNAATQNSFEQQSQYPATQPNTQLQSQYPAQPNTQQQSDILNNQLPSGQPENGGVGPTAFVPDDIRSVQIALKNRGYDPGDINGMMSSQTLEAIRQFQMANHLPETGMLDDKTQMALGVTVRGTQLSQLENPERE